jgi:hypothetical protein
MNELLKSLINNLIMFYFEIFSFQLNKEIIRYYFKAKEKEIEQ